MFVGRLFAAQRVRTAAVLQLSAGHRVHYRQANLAPPSLDARSCSQTCCDAIMMPEPESRSHVLPCQIDSAHTFVVRPKNLSGSSTSILMGSSAEIDLTLKAVRTSSSDAPGGTSTGSDADTFTYSTRRDSCSAHADHARARQRLGGSVASGKTTDRIDDRYNIIYVKC